MREHHTVAFGGVHRSTRHLMFMVKPNLLICIEASNFPSIHPNKACLGTLLEHGRLIEWQTHSRENKHQRIHSRAAFIQATMAKCFSASAVSLALYIFSNHFIIAPAESRNAHHTPQWMLLVYCTSSLCNYCTPLQQAWLRQQQH